jgi:hypothetical protein
MLKRSIPAHIDSPFYLRTFLNLVTMVQIAARASGYVLTLALAVQKAIKNKSKKTALLRKKTLSFNADIDIELIQ